MADAASRKVVVIRKKPEELKVEASTTPTPGELITARTGSGPTEKQRQRSKRHIEKWQEAHPGLRHVQFVIEVELWDRFVARCCSAGKPNTVFTRMVREAVVIAEKTEQATH